MRMYWLGRMVWLLAVLGGFCRAFGADGVSSVTILTYSGTAEVSRRTGVWDPAHTNQVLYVGDRMRTGPNSRASILLSDGTTMTIGAEANFEVPESKKGVTLNPLKGLFYFFHRDKPGEFELRSRTTAAAVRGTEFALAASEDGTWQLSVLDGDVFLQTDQGDLDLKTGQAALAQPGQKPQTILMRQANDLIQWCLYYPVVLNPGDLNFTAAEADELKSSLAAYRTGDVAAALALLPANAAAGSDAAAIYRAELLLSVGEVADAEKLLDGVAATGAGADRVQSVQTALRELIAVVKAQPRVRPPANAPLTASAWLAESYRLQSESRLADALAAARHAASMAPDFGFAWERVAELEFCFGSVGPARDALREALRLSPRYGPAKTLEGFLFAAEDHVGEAVKAFDASIALDGSQGDAWLGRGLSRIRRGEIDAGRRDILVAASLEPQRAVFRSYLAKAMALAGNPGQAHKELALAQHIDPNDPTAWLYSALLLLEENRINEAIDSLEKSSALNENRSVFRSRQLLDQDRSVRGANLAGAYQDDGMNEVAVREATRAVENDYANFSAHLFLADSYNALRDPQQVNLRYETPWLSEYLVANLLAPVGAGVLSPTISEQEYARLFEQNHAGLASETQYSSRGDWTQSAVQYGRFDKSSYAVEENYYSQHGDRTNDDLEQLTVSVRLKEQITPQDSVYFQGIYYDANGGDLAPYYNQNFANPTLRTKEEQLPQLILGYHHEWAPGVHTLLLAGRLEDDLQVTNAAADTIFISSRLGVKGFASFAQYNQFYHDDQDIYVSELQQIFEVGSHTVIFGARYQAGDFNVHSFIANGMTVPGGTPTGPSMDQNIAEGFDRVGFYGYEQWRALDTLLLQAGVSYDTVHYPDNYLFAPVSNASADRSRLGPKAGLVWTPAPGTVLRGGFSRALGGVSFDQSFRLEPVQIGGINQAFRSIIPEAVAGQISAPAYDVYGAQFEQEFPTRTYLGITAGLLQSDNTRTVGAVQFDPFSPGAFNPVPTRQSLNYDERTAAVTLNQLLCDEIAVGATYQISRAKLETGYPDIPSSAVLASPFVLNQDQKATLQQVRLYGVLNLPSGFFFGGEALWYGQENSGYTPSLEGDDFWQFNAYGGYRWWRRHAELRVDLKNLSNQSYNLNPLNLTTELPYERTLLVSFKFAF